MGTTTKIQWADHTFNPWIGCSKVHAGCTHCYAEAGFDNRLHVAQWGLRGTRVVTGDASWQKPLLWNLAAQRAGVRRRVFCASLADVFEAWEGCVSDSDGQFFAKPPLDSQPKNWIRTDEAPSRSRDPQGWRDVTLHDVRRRLFALIDQTPYLDWMLLTKRPERIRDFWPSADVFDGESLHKAYWPNIWLGTSISDQETADRMLPELLKCRDLARVLFVSAEPLLGKVDLHSSWSHAMRAAGWHTYHENLNDCPNCNAGENQNDSGYACSCCHGTTQVPGIDWVIVGGESGPKARPCDVAWIEAIVHQCRDSSVPCFVKQMGSEAGFTAEEQSGQRSYQMLYTRNCGFWREDLPGWILSMRDRKGGDPQEWPAELRVQQFPTVESASV